jgi:hypothetical protein
MNRTRGNDARIMARALAEENARNAIYIVKILNQLKQLFELLYDNPIYNEYLNGMEQFTGILVHYDWAP